MKRLFLLSASLLLVFSLSACHKEKSPEATETPVTNEPTETADIEIPEETEEITITEEPQSEAEVTDSPNSVNTTEIPVDFQKEGWISSNEAITLLKMFLGSYDDSGNELSFGHESTILKDGKYYYNFRITSLVISESGMAHQSYFGNYLVSTDGIDIIEYTTE